MKHKKPPIILIVIIVIGGIIGALYFSGALAGQQELLSRFNIPTSLNAETAFTASGFIEANEVKVSPEVGGRIITLEPREGEAVAAGQIVARLDPALLEAQIEQVEAQIALAEAQLAQLEAGAPQEQVAVVDAQVTLARAGWAGAHDAWQDAILIRDTPQQLNAQIDAARSQLDLGDMQIEQATLMVDAVELRESIAADLWELRQQGIDFSINIPGMGKISRHIDFKEGEKQQASVEWNLATMDVWEAWVNLEKARSNYDSTQEQLQTLLATRQNPLQADLQVSQAEANYNSRLADLRLAEANLAQIEARPSETRINILQANLEQARSQLDTLLAQREKFALHSPIDGTVVARSRHPGEVALPGNAILTVAGLSRLTLTVYVSAADYGRLREGQAVEVVVDSFPEQTFPGTIIRISDEAEFTPKNVQTREERVNLVYAIKIALPNESSQLKPGMPADVSFSSALAEGENE